MGIKSKLFIGYFILVVIAGFTGWLVNAELVQADKRRLELNPVNGKVIFINEILANLYNAESLERNLVYTGEVTYFSQYQHLLDTIRLQIDSLTALINNPYQKKHADSIKILLDKKQTNLQELMYLKNNYSLNALYKQTLQQLDTEKDSIVQYYEINQRQTKTYDTVYIKHEKKPFLRRLFKAFGDQETKDSAMQVKISEYIQTDSLKAAVNPSDSIATLLSTIKSELQTKSERAERQIKSRELIILDSDKTITLQLKKILTIIENEELLNSLKAVREQQKHNAEITWIILFLGVLSLFTIVYFGTNILRDLSKSQHYRQSLEVAKTETEKVLKSKEQFMLSLTHDLKSPLNAIIGFTRLIGSEPVNNTTSRYLNNIDRSSQHILELVNQLLDLAKLQQGRLKIVEVPFNLFQLVEQVAENYRVGALQKNVEFHLTNQLEAVRNYKGDAVRVTQILVNLLSNAIKFTREGSVEFRITLKSHDKFKDIVKFEVIDTGVGIDAEDLPHIFEEFTRGKADNQKFEGTGLGLAITYKLVQLLQGEVKIASEVGVGSHFKVYLPFSHTTEIPAVQTLENQRIVPGNSKRELAGINVLLVDDDAQMLEMVEAVLNAEGMEVHAYNNPEKALQTYCKGDAQVLITDLQMPGIEGPDLHAQLMEKTAEPLPAILMSGKDAFGGKQLNDQFLGYVQKPFEPALLLNMLRLHVDEIRAGSGLTDLENTETTPAYRLDNIKKFLGEGTENLHHFLVSYTTNSLEHLALLADYNAQKNTVKIRELAHKMLNILHQLQAAELIEIFMQLENTHPSKEEEAEYLQLTTRGIEGMQRLIEAICRDEGVQL